MFRITHRAATVAALATLAVLALAGTSFAGHGPTPNHDPACSVPASVSVGQQFTLSASALPTVDPVWLIVTAPSGGTTLTPVYVDADGAWSTVQSASQPGTWTYSFSGLFTNKRYGTVESCSTQAS